MVGRSGDLQRLVAHLAEREFRDIQRIPLAGTRAGARRGALCALPGLPDLPARRPDEPSPPDSLQPLPLLRRPDGPPLLRERGVRARHAAMGIGRRRLLTNARALFEQT